MNEVQVWGGEYPTKRGKRQTGKNKYTAELAQLVEQLIRPKMNEVLVWGSSTRQNEVKGKLKKTNILPN